MSDTPLPSNPFNNPEMSYDTPSGQTPSGQTPYFTPHTGKTPTRRSKRISGAVSKKSTKKASPKKKTVKSTVSNPAKANRNPNITNTLIFDEERDHNRTLGWKTNFPNVTPDKLVFVYYDEPLRMPTEDFPGTINGYSLKDIITNKNGAVYYQEQEYPLYVQEFTFDKKSSDIFNNGAPFKRNVIMIKYNGKNTKLKYGGTKDPSTDFSGNKPLQYFYTEEYDYEHPNNPDPYIKYYGTFLYNQNANPSSFGKKRKGSKGLHNELKYLLSIK